TIDLIGENQVSKNRTALKLELAPATGGLHDDVGAENVSRHEVRRKLYAIKGKVQHLAQGPNQERFAQSRHAFQQHMASGEQRNEGAFDNWFLTDDHLGQFGSKAGIGFGKGLDLSFGGHSLS